MKKSNFWKLLSGTAFFAAVALASCVDDNDDKGMPYLEVTPDVLTFNADGAPEGASAFTVKSKSERRLLNDIRRQLVAEAFDEYLL